MIFDRVQSSQLRELLRTFPVVAVIGARQVGKSTLVQLPAVGKGRAYQTLDDFATLGLAQKDPFALIGSFPKVTIDEAQRAPELLMAIKREVDTNRVPGRFLLTGSADLNFSAGLSQVLAGRVGVLRLRPLSWREQAGRLKSPKLISWLSRSSISSVEKDVAGATLPNFDHKLILRGGYPLAVTASSPRARELWINSFRYSYLEREIRQLSEIGKLSDFARLLELAATRTGQLLNQAALGRDAGLSAATAGRYFSLMEATFQIERVRPYFVNIGKRLVKSPKLYWTDTGVACSLLGLRTWKEALGAGYAGSLIETLVMMEVKCMLEAWQPQARLHFLRSHGGLEIDGLITSGRHLLPFEVKASSTVRVDDARHLKTFLAAEERARLGLLLYGGTETKRLATDIIALPLTALLA